MVLVVFENPRLDFRLDSVFTKNKMLIFEKRGCVSGSWSFLSFPLLNVIVRYAFYSGNCLNMHGMIQIIGIATDMKMFKLKIELS